MPAMMAHYEQAYGHLTFLFLQKSCKGGGRSSFVDTQILTLLRGTLDEFSIRRHVIITILSIGVLPSPPGVETVICR